MEKPKKPMKPVVPPLPHVMYWYALLPSSEHGDWVAGKPLYVVTPLPVETSSSCECGTTSCRVPRSVGTKWAICVTGVALKSCESQMSHLYSLAEMALSVYRTHRSPYSMHCAWQLRKWLR